MSVSAAQLAFLFPGQGSQSVGMLDNLLASPHASALQAILQTASDALGQDLSSLIAQGPAEALNLTVNTQPVMLAADLACFAAYRAASGPMPGFMAGHSLGEYAAISAAGSMSLVDAVRAVRFRAEQMQAAVPVGVGGMAAILGLPSAAVEAGCQAISRPDAVVEAVNFNAPDQTVIAGHLSAVEAACAALKEQGAKRALMLPVSAPFHSSLLAPAAQALAEHLTQIEIRPPTLTVLHNVDVQSHGTPDAIRQALSQQAMSPVRWVSTIQALAAQGVTTVVECGPGKVLAGMVKRIAPELTTHNIYDQASLEACLEALA